MNPHRVISKLQRALSAKDILIVVKQDQFYASDSGKLLTKYTVSEQREGARNTKLLETYSVVEVVKFLASLCGGGSA